MSLGKRSLAEEMRTVPIPARLTPSEVRLPRLIGSSMVLQRDVELNIWGWAAPGEKVTVEFCGERQQATANGAGEWRVELGPHPPGGPHSMTICCGHSSVCLTDIYIGDVWLAAGQSNMELGLAPVDGWKGVTNYSREIIAAHFPKIRLFHVDTNPAATPEQDVRSVAGWQAVTPETVAQFSAVAYLFGRALHHQHRVPVGLIQTAVGGTFVEAWMSAAALRPFPEFGGDVAALACANDNATKRFDEYLRSQARWYEQHGNEDRGLKDGSPVWADPAHDTSRWPTISLPRSLASCGKDFGGFNGVVWLRRVFEFQCAHTAEGGTLHLGVVVNDCTVYLNGTRLQEVDGRLNDRVYDVPSESVRQGENCIAIRVVGLITPAFSCTGLYNYLDDERPAINLGDQLIPLTGEWSYESGPSLDDFPATDAEALGAHPTINTPTALFNGMVHPIARFEIMGMLWYQGESNALDHRALQYRKLFADLIRDWRRHWGRTVPFLFVQLPGYGQDGPEPLECSWADFREAQAAALSLPLTGMVVTVDIGDEQDIHPRNKQDVAARLVLAAARIAYEIPLVHSGPVFESMVLERGQVRIRFSCIGSGLVVRDRYGYVRGFQITDARGKFHWAKARIEGTEIVVFNEAISDPAHVRYCWGNSPDGNVCNSEGLPAAPFRTDSPRT